MQETKKIDEKLLLNINGVRQGMFLKGADIHNPVLLYLHGGSGSSEIALGSRKVFRLYRRGSGGLAASFRAARL